jgi:Fur family ferric uptake transcriptional regulator
VLNQKLRMTRQRRMILEEVRKAKSHPTAYEVYKKVQDWLPRISLGTVYRNLEILSESGMVQKLDWGGGQRRFDGETQNHYHIRCVRCGRVDDVPIKPVASLEETLRTRTEYEVIGHRLEFLGLCPQCKSKETGD